MNVVSRKTSGAVTPTASTSPLWISTPPMSTSTLDWLMRSGTEIGDEPSHRTPTFCRMKEKPIAVISGASLGALRSGL